MAHTTLLEILFQCFSYTSEMKKVCWGQVRSTDTVDTISNCDDYDN